MTYRLPSLPFIWVLLALLVVFFEGVALGRPARGDSLSEMVWLVRDNPIGRFVFLPLWCWLTYHLVLKTPKSGALGWEDMTAIAAGLAWAFLETRR